MPRAKTLQKTDLIELNEAYNSMLIWFFSFPTEAWSLSDLAKNLEIAKTTANKITKQLEKEGFLKIEEIGKSWRIRCNQQHSYMTTKKIAYNLEMIYEANLISIVQEAIPQYKAIILFGSYRKGDDTEKSDIDLAVEVADDDDIQIVPLGLLPTLGWRKDITVNLHVFTRNKIDHNVFANIANGILLDGFLEVRP